MSMHVAIFELCAGITPEQLQLRGAETISGCWVLAFQRDKARFQLVFLTVKFVCVYVCMSTG